MIVTRLVWTVTCATALASCGWLAGLKSYGLSGDGGDGSGGDASDAPPSGSPMKPTAMFPWNGYDTGAVAASTSVMPTFSWAAVGGAMTYEIELSSKCSVATMQSCSALDDDLMTLDGATSYTPLMALDTAKSAPVGERWFWRIAACNGAGCNWSDVRYLNVGRLADDVNGDGRSDLEVGTQISELWQFGDGSAAGSNVGGGSFGSGFGLEVSTGDFNGDGFSDLAVYAAGADLSGAIYVLLGGTAAHSPTVLSSGQAPNARFGQASMSPGDLDGDGYDDLVVVTDKDVVMFPGGSAGPAGEFTQLTAADDTIYSNGFGAVGDVDGDGFPDFAVASAGGSVTLFYGPVTSGRTARIDPPTNESPWGVAITGGDIDGDGFSDVIISGVSSLETGVIYAFHGGANGVSTTPMPLYSETATTSTFGRALLYQREGASFALGIGDSAQAWVAIGSAAPGHVDAPRGSTATTFGGELGGGDFAGSGYDAFVIGAIGDQTLSATNACGVAYVFQLEQTSTLGESELDPPDCALNEAFGISISR